jgi:hypothetical protein
MIRTTRHILMFCAALLAPPTAIHAADRQMSVDTYSLMGDPAALCTFHFA